MEGGLGLCAGLKQTVSLRRSIGTLEGRLQGAQPTPTLRVIARLDLMPSRNAFPIQTPRCGRLGMSIAP